MSGEVLTHDANPYAPPPPAAEEAPPLSTVEAQPRLRTLARGLLPGAVWGRGAALLLGAMVAIEMLDSLPRFTDQDQSEVLTITCTLLAFLPLAGTTARGASATVSATDLYA